MDQLARKISVFVCSFAMLTLSISAYAGSDKKSSGAEMGHSRQTDHSSHTMMGHDDPQQAGAHFLEAFSKHHKDGISMAKMAVDKAQDPEIKKLARKMVKDQNSEIEQMQKWRKQYYGSVPTMDPDVPKMDMSKLEKASGKEFDSRFAEMMARHHEDGIKMARNAADKIQVKQVKQFAEQAAKNQSKERDELVSIQDKIEASKSATTQPE